MNLLFGKERAQRLRDELSSLAPSDRELTIIEEISQALKVGGKYVLPFCFKNYKGNRTSHHLIFVSKDKKGYHIMKDIMAKESTGNNHGVPSFMYNPAPTSRQTLLFWLSRPIEELGDMLLANFSGRTITMREIYEEHNIDRPYIPRNYKEALRQLEAERKIIANPPADQRRKRKGIVTFGEDVKVTFPVWSI